MEKANQSRTEKPTIIFDTCIVQYALGPYTGEAIEPHISDYQDKFDARISAITVYEGAKKTKYPEVDEFLAYCTKEFGDPYEVTYQVLHLAGNLNTFYSRTENVEPNSISTADRIIAATAAFTGSTVLTSNRSDFPAPYFDETASFTFEYKRGQKASPIKVYALLPDVAYLEKRVNERFASRGRSSTKGEA